MPEARSSQPVEVDSIKFAQVVANAATSALLHVNRMHLFGFPRDSSVRTVLATDIATVSFVDTNLRINEEVLQECYVSIWAHAPDYRAGLAAPMTWMTSIVRNRCLDSLRRPSLETADADGSIAEQAPSPDPGPLEELERVKDAQALGRCLGELEAQHRQAIALAFYDGLSHAEIARHLRAPLGTVKTWVRRGLLRLKGCLDAAR